MGEIIDFKEKESKKATEERLQRKVDYIDYKLNSFIDSVRKHIPIFEAALQQSRLQNRLSEMEVKRIQDSYMRILNGESMRILEDRLSHSSDDVVRTRTLGEISRLYDEIALIITETSLMIADTEGKGLYKGL